MVVWSPETVNKLREGQVGVVPTDTIYGLACSVFHPEAIARMYTLKQRNPAKPFVVLLADEADLQRLGIILTPAQTEKLDQYWPGPVSLILPCPSEALAYLHRSTFSLACRLPQDDVLREMLRQTGPLATSSANREGESSATTIAEAKASFGVTVDFYVDDGQKDGKPSTIINLTHPDGVTLRP